MYGVDGADGEDFAAAAGAAAGGFAAMTQDALTVLNEVTRGRDEKSPVFSSAFPHLFPPRSSSLVDPFTNATSIKLLAPPSLRSRSRSRRTSRCSRARS